MVLDFSEEETNVEYEKLTITTSVANIDMK